MTGADATNCSIKEFPCKTREGTKCMPLMFKCDNFQDCDDNEDERDCGTGGTIIKFLFSHSMFLNIHILVI